MLAFIAPYLITLGGTTKYDEEYRLRSDTFVQCSSRITETCNALPKNKRSFTWTSGTVKCLVIGKVKSISAAVE